MSAAKVREALASLARVARATADQADAIAALADRYLATLRGGGTLYFAGNGGSAADAQHVATEYVVRLRRRRRALAAVALTTDTSLLTAAANDLGFDEVFARQVEGLCRAGDLLMLHSTSGDSINLLRAAETARAKDVVVVALLGRGGGRLKDAVDQSVIVQEDEVSRIQEVHLAVEHIIADLVEEGIGAS